MLELDVRQQAMLSEMGIRLPWPAPVQTKPSIATTADVIVHNLRSQALTQETGEAVPPPQHIKKQHDPASALTQKMSEASSTELVLTAADQATQSVQLQAHAQRITIMPWAELEEAARGCDACALCKSRKNTVFSAGVSTAQWMIVGEAPGEQEDKQGEPFVGPAGQLLDCMIGQLGLSRSPAENQQAVYISNVLKCRPPRNRNPEPTEMALCKNFLERQIELVQPKLILVVGRFAVQTLLQTQEAIGRLRGKVHHYKGIPAIVTYHPAYLLRNPIDKRKSWEDLCLAAQTFADLT